MNTGHIFISHATDDDEFAAKLRAALENYGLTVWVDSRNLRGGDTLAPEIRKAIQAAGYVLVVLSPNTINSIWVPEEIKIAQKAKKRVVPLLLKGIKPSALGLWFKEEPLAVTIERADGLVEAMPALLAALGERRPTDPEFRKTIETTPLEELILELSDPKIVEKDGKRRAAATARLTYKPASGAPPVESQRFKFSSPLGALEKEDLRWYLEQYWHWPLGVFKERAAKVEQQLKAWGQALYAAALDLDSTRNALESWQHVQVKGDRRFSVVVETDPVAGASEEEQAECREAAALLLGLPWELLHSGKAYLFKGGKGVRVLRSLPNREAKPVIVTKPPIRILLLSPRPEDQRADYFDHRSSAKPLVEAIAALGDLASVTVLTPPTFRALETELLRAEDAEEPYHVVHFDGHGVYDKRVGLGGLCFEEPEDAAKLEKRRATIIDAEKLAELLTNRRIPLFFLDACQTAQAEVDPSASVATAMLERGVASVIAMSHSVLVETARRFVREFYQELTSGRRVGKAMLSGQQELYANTYRGKIMGAGDLHLQDWFVPVLFQEHTDPQLISELPSEKAQQLQTQRRKLSLGDLPAPPEHRFIGRSRELLKIERLLAERQYAVLTGEGGEGKTAIAVESARWLAATECFQRAAFVCVEDHSDARTILDQIGRQLVPDYSVAQYAGDLLKEALQPVERALGDHATIIVMDNMESILPRPGFEESTPNPSHNTVDVTDVVRKSGHFDSAQCDTVSDCAASRSGLSSEHHGSDGETTSSSVTLSGVEVPDMSAQFRTSTALGDGGTYEPEILQGVFQLCRKFLEVPGTKMIFTSREALPFDFAQGDTFDRVYPERSRRTQGDIKGSAVKIDRLLKSEAIELVGSVMAAKGLTPPEGDSGDAPDEIKNLVAAVNCHARSLALLAPEISHLGVKTTTAQLGRLMAQLHEKYPHSREQSLFASIELSLRRLSPQTREQIRVLGLFQGGVHIGVLSQILQLEPDGAAVLVTELVNTGLAEDMGCGHLRLHPALCPYLLGELAETERERAASAWAGGMVALAKDLYKERSKDARLAATLTLLELPNLLALLEYLHQTATAEAVVNRATRLERLLQNLGRPAALARVVTIREAAAAQLGAWSNARFEAEASSIDRMWQSGQLQQALDAAQDLLQDCLNAGEEAYDGADYDIASIYWLLGRMLKMGGLSQAALQPLAEAQARFQVIADTGDRNAAHMASAAITERGDCLRDLGRLDEAASAYQEAIQRNEKLDDRRQVAVGTLQLGTVRKDQQRYDDALEAYRSARDIFEQLGEPGSVAVIWHQTGMVHKNAGNFDAAEEAYRKSLAIKVQQKNQPGEALSLGELGNLYDRMGRLEEAVTFYRQAADICVRIQDLAFEGLCRSNIANTLIKLQDFDEARGELQRALECKKPFGHAAEPWKTWNLLHNLEQAVGNPAAAANARAEAIRAYLAYRRAGGENQDVVAKLCALVAQAIQKGDTTEAEEILASYLTPDANSRTRAIIPALQAILRGSRDAALAEGSALDYDDAVELRLLLEGLG